MKNVKASLISNIEVANIHHGAWNVHHVRSCSLLAYRLWSTQAIQHFSESFWDDIRQFRATKNTLPFTVTKLQALVRLSESLAKKNLQNDVTGAHVRETMCIFLVSNMNANLDSVTKILTWSSLRSSASRRGSERFKIYSTRDSCHGSVPKLTSFL